MSEEQIRARDAESLLANPVFKGAIARMEAYLEAQALSTDPDNREKCARVVISKQILKGIVREITRYIEDGEIRDIIELEARKKTLKQRVFER